MVRRVKKSSIYNTVDSRFSLNAKPSLYNIVLFNDINLSKDNFIALVEECFSYTVIRAGSLYSELKVRSHVKCGPYTKDIAETIACKVKSANDDHVCCIVKN